MLEILSHLVAEMIIFKKSAEKEKKLKYPSVNEERDFSINPFIFL